MSQLHPTDEDRAWADGHAEAGFKMRVAWVKKLRAALTPFAQGIGNKTDEAHARKVLDETKEWL